MGRRKGDTPQKAALRQLMQGYLKAVSYTHLDVYKRQALP